MKVSVVTSLVLVLTVQAVFLKTARQKKAVFDLIPQQRIDRNLIKTKSKLRNTLRRLWNISFVNWKPEQGKRFRIKFTENKYGINIVTI